jgi:CHASE2 domain-containing sensor protein
VRGAETGTPRRAPAHRFKWGRLFHALSYALCVAAAVIVMRIEGWLQPAELALMYDQLRIAWAGSEPSNLVLLVGLTETDLEADDQGKRRWGFPVPDGALAALLERIALWQPRAIGVDMYRDAPYPPGTEKLRATLRDHQNIYWVFKIKGDENHPGIPPPEPLAGTDRAVFADNVEDADQVLRRALLFAEEGTSQYTGLGMALGEAYLARERIAPQPAENDGVRLGKAVITPLEARRGPYVKIDDRGFQILIDYHGGRMPFRQISFSDVMDRNLSALARDRIVIVGYNAESVKDYFTTPFSTGFNAEPLPGFAVHGHVAEQLVRMALTGASELSGLPHFWESAILVLVAVAGALATHSVRTWWRAFVIVPAGAVALAGTVYAAFGFGVWLPGLPAAAIWLIVTGGLAVWEFAVVQRLERQQRELDRVRLLAMGRELLLLASAGQESELDEAEWQAHCERIARELLATLAAVDPDAAEWQGIPAHDVGKG